MSEEFDKEAYRKTNIELFNDNNDVLIKFCFVINVICLFVKSIVLAKFTLVIMLLSFLISIIGSNLALEERYGISNKLFDVAEVMDFIVVALTLVAILLI